MSKFDAGKALRLTLDERVRQRIRTMFPIDRTEQEVAAFYRDRKRKRDKERQTRIRRLARASRTAAKDLDVREESLYAALNGQCRTVADLGRELSRHKAWQSAAGGHLPAASMRKAVYRAILALHKRNLLHLQPGTGSRGQPLLRVRKSTAVTVTP